MNSVYCKITIYLANIIIMKHIKIGVPSHVAKISAWEDFELQLPKGSMVLNKVFPGCGMTYYYLHSNNPVLLCGPRNSLLINKVEQLDEECENRGAVYSFDGTKVEYFFFTPSTRSNEAERCRENEMKFEELRRIVNGSPRNPFTPEVFIPKVLVTYDSLPTIWPIIMESRMRFEVIMDESHVLFQDYTMKPDVIERALSVMRSYSRVIYVSATPVMREYLERMETFGNLPYVELVWPENRVRNVDVFYRPMSSTIEEACRIIEYYRQTGMFDEITVDDHTYHSTEAVFFINNVKHIVDIIGREGLRSSEVNILVSSESKNRALLKKLGQDFHVGRIPTKGKRHKTFTFCSKAVFFGCDFYSDSASTYIFADANIRSMTTDISLDYHQIVGRQRLESNVFRNRCTIFVKSPKGDFQSEEEFRDKQQNRWEISEAICKEWNNMTQRALEAIQVNSKKCPYGVIYQDPITENWVSKNSINALIAEEHAWRLRNQVYRNHESVKSLMCEEGFKMISPQTLPPQLMEFYNNIMGIRDISEGLRYYCSFFDANPELLEYVGLLPYVHSEYEVFYSYFGTAYLRERNYNMQHLQKDYEYQQQHKEIMDRLRSDFVVGESYLKSVIKEKIQNIYDEINIARTAKASDLQYYYVIKDVLLTLPGGKRVAGFRIIHEL